MVNAEDIKLSNTNPQTAMNIKEDSVEKDDLKKKSKCVDGKYFKEFALNTSLHGVKYTSESDKSTLSRIWWTIMVVCSFLTCVYLIRQVWLKWEQNPVIVSFAELSTPVWQIPFPAITICSMTKFKKNVFNFTEVCDSKNNSNDKLAIYDAVATMCLDGCLENRTLDYINNTFFEEIIENICIKRDDILLSCFKYGKDDCDELFTPIITDEGLCYTSNMLNANAIYHDNVYYNKEYHLNHNKSSKGWSLEKGYKKRTPFVTYPERGKGLGIKGGLQITMIVAQNDVDYKCCSFYRGFKMVVHAPNTIPQFEENFIWIPVKLQTTIAVKPQMIKTSKGIKQYSPESRGCLLTHEKKLRFFKEYTQDNCRLECITNYTLKICGCVDYYMPRDFSTHLCAAGKLDCINTASENFSSKSDFTDDDDDDDSYDSQKNLCNCEPSCTSLTYETEVSQVKIEYQKYAESFNLSDMMEGQDYAMAIVYFKNPQFIPSKRSQLYGITDFLANCGGILGVCMGFSILSLVEIVYFFLIRVLSDWKKKYQPQK